MLTVSKYHGCGNDFLLLENQMKTSAQKSRLARILCERHTGIGADGMIFLYTDPLTMEIYNSDGSFAPMCGNGIRCFAKYAYDHRIISQNDFTVKTGDGIKTLHVHSFDPFLVSVDMGKASFDPGDTLVRDNQLFQNDPLLIQDQLFFITTVFMTTLHTVIFIDQAASFSLEKYGKLIHEHSLFPNKTNVNFVRIIDRSRIEVSTYERGAGMTLACGSGCCASVYVAWKQGLVDRAVQVDLSKGNLQIQIDEKEHLIMCGSAVKIMDAFVDMNLFD